MTELAYEKSWLSPSDFPTVQESEEQVRSDLMFHPEAVRSYINGTLIPETEALIGEEIAAASISPLGCLDTDLSHNSDGYIPSSKAVITALSALRSEISGINALGISSGGYTGEGAVGSGNPCVLNFQKAPELILIYDAAGSFMIISPNMSTAVSNCGLGEKGLNRLSFSDEGKTLGFYAFYSSSGTVSPVHQMNEAGNSYFYLALVQTGE